MRNYESHFKFIRKGFGKRSQQRIDTATEKYPDKAKNLGKAADAGMKILLMIWGAFILFFIIGFVIFIAAG